MFERLLTLIDDDTLKIISNKKLLLVGVGGVGGYAFEALIRSGFSDITIVDGDTIALSNLNRQIITTEHNINEEKVLEAQKRALAINSKAHIKPIFAFLTKENFSEYINEDYDYIIDACDDIKVKIELIKYAQEKNIKIITCLGTGRKLNPCKLEITTLNKTYNDPLAKKLRSSLRRENINLKIPVVFSSEEAIKTVGTIGSAIFVPAVAGIYLANYIFKDILNNNYQESVK
ncbi:MAG: tRNA threonylcarbamoyladenosine dehydratase [Bacilli bacterium]|nr:tRNA threonylcarbamoyladenosine dehydratase [Bacilli bacterium]